MLNNSSELISLNYTLIPRSAYKPEQKNAILTYEVIRLVDGVPLFFDKHLNRLLNTLASVNLNFKPDKQRLQSSLKKLIQRNKLSNTNIRITIFDENILIQEQSAFYPLEEDFEKGVHVATVEIERQNPQEKIYREHWKKEVEQRIKDAQVYELLLVNKQGLITEGSRSNVFFIRENTMFSAEESLILPGITRSEILIIAKRMGIQIEFSKVDKHSLLTYDAAFLCGTSIQVLPISKIDDKSFRIDNAVLRKLQMAFQERFEQEFKKSMDKWKK